MSADNWGVCPKCLAEAKKNQISGEELHAAYGTVPRTEWEDMRLRQGLELDEDDFRTLREDCEFWMTRQGSFNVQYGAECTECGFTHDFSYSEQLALT